MVNIWEMLVALDVSGRWLTVCYRPNEIGKKVTSCWNEAREPVHWACGVCRRRNRAKGRRVDAPSEPPDCAARGWWTKPAIRDMTTLESTIMTRLDAVNLWENCRVRFDTERPWEGASASSLGGRSDYHLVLTLTSLCVKIFPLCDDLGRAFVERLFTDENWQAADESESSSRSVAIWQSAQSSHGTFFYLFTSNAQ